MLEPFLKQFYNIFHLDVHYVCMLVQSFEPQGRRFTNFHYYYYYYFPKSLWWIIQILRNQHTGSVIERPEHILLNCTVELL